jgi:hypothetical protein
MPLDRKLLGIYLNDHLAGSTVGAELCKRAAGSNRGTEYGDFLEGLCREIEEDRQTLRKVMDELEVGEDRLKVLVAFVAERAGRLKLNGRISGYSPLSRVVELEALALGVTGKLALWRALRDLDDPRLAGIGLDELERRAERQQDQLEEHRVRAVREALAEG